MEFKSYCLFKGLASFLKRKGPKLNSLKRFVPSRWASTWRRADLQSKSSNYPWNVSQNLIFLHSWRKLLLHSCDYSHAWYSLVVRRLIMLVFVLFLINSTSSDVKYQNKLYRLFHQRMIDFSFINNLAKTILFISWVSTRSRLDNSWWSEIEFPDIECD